MKITSKMALKQAKWLKNHYFGMTLTFDLELKVKVIHCWTFYKRLHAFIINSYRDIIEKPIF